LGNLLPCVKIYLFFFVLTVLSRQRAESITVFVRAIPACIFSALVRCTIGQADPKRTAILLYHLMLNEIYIYIFHLASASGLAEDY
jgi:hypothetical protein